MADTPNQVERDIADYGASGGDVTRKDAENAYQPTYRVVGSAKIPVSKSTGTLWKSRLEAGKKFIKDDIERWDEVFAYFNNDQYPHRTPREGTSANTDVAMRRNKIHAETENIIYANIMAMVPALYAKNPNGEITGAGSQDDEFKDAIRVGEQLIKTLCAMKVAPGFNLRSKLRRCVTSTLLTNEAWIVYGYTKKEESNEQSLQELNDLGEALEKAKDTKEIQEIEGKLMALEEASDFLSPPGPQMKVMLGKHMIIDPDCCEEDLSDAKWLSYPLFLPTAYLRAKYAKKGEDEQYYSVYQPTHVLDAKNKDKGSEHEDFDSMSLFDSSREHADYGYSNKENYNRSQYTKVWFTWDRITRRLYLFNDCDWSWPVWVFNDPYGLPGFFPVKRQSFNAHPFKMRGRGEVSYYLDQQDAVNDINDETCRIRKALKFKVIYNKNHVKDPSGLEAFFANDTQKAFGIDVPEGVKIEELFAAPPFPALQHKEFFDKQPIYQAADRISNVSDIIRGAQFKTNTTNKAIEEYNSLINQKYDEKIDGTEEFVGDVLADILFLCLKFMSTEEVVRLIGDNGGKTAAAWEQLKTLTENKVINYRVVGGSTQKPTSAAKKQEALQMGQILGQFSSASPTVLLVVLKMFEKAFDDFIISAEDWEMIRTGIQQALQAQAAPPGGGSAGSEEQPTGPMNEEQQQAVIERMKQKGVPEEMAKAKLQEFMKGHGANNG